MPAHQPSVQSTQSIPVVVQQVRPAPVQLVPAHPTAYTHALTGCGRSLSYLFAAIALTAVAVLHLLDLLLGISGGIESVWAAIDASPSGLMQFLQAAFWLPGAADRHRRVVCCRGLQKPRRADLDRRAELPAHGGRLPHHLRGT